MCRGIRIIVVLLCGVSLSHSSGQWRTRYGFQYYFSDDDATWSDARESCLDLDADLASVHSEGEHEWILDRIDSHRGFGDTRYYWIGLRSVSNDERRRVWQWSDGTNVSDTWWEEEPSRVASDSGRAECACYYDGRFSVRYDWYYKRCSENYIYRFICKKALVKDVDDCLNNACPLNAECVNTPSSYVCECSPGFTGDRCETDLNGCPPNPNGTLSSGCVDGSGANDTHTEMCDYATCQNGGTCVNVNHTAGFSCRCTGAFSGKICDVTVTGKNGKTDKGKSSSPVVIVIGCVIAGVVICLITMLLLVCLCKCRRKLLLSKHVESQLELEGSHSAHQRLGSVVVTTENDVYEHSPLHSPVRYAVDGVLYTAPNQWNEGENVHLKHSQIANKENEPLYSMEQAVLPHSSEDPLPDGTDTAVGKRTESGRSLYSKEGPVRLGSDHENAVSDAASQEPTYDIPIPTAKPRNTLKPAPGQRQTDSPKVVFLPSLSREQSRYAKEHYRLSEDAAASQPRRPSEQETIYVNHVQATQPESHYDLQHDAYHLEAAIPERVEFSETGSDNEPKQDGVQEPIYTYADHEFKPATLRSAPVATDSVVSSGEYSPTYMPMSPGCRTKKPEMTFENHYDE